MMILLYFIFIATASIWLFGIYWLWKNQNASKPSVSVNLSDRLVAIFWPPCYVAIAVALLFFKHKKRIHSNSISPSTQELAGAESAKAPSSL